MTGKLLICIYPKFFPRIPYGPLSSQWADKINLSIKSADFINNFLKTLINQYPSFHIHYLLILDYSFRS